MTARIAIAKAAIDNCRQSLRMGAQILDDGYNFGVNFLPGSTGRRRVPDAPIGEATVRVIGTRAAVDVTQKKRSAFTPTSWTSRSLTRDITHTEAQCFAPPRSGTSRELPQAHALH